MLKKSLGFSGGGGLEVGSSRAELLYTITHLLKTNS